MKMTRLLPWHSIQSQFLVRSSIAVIAATLGLADMVSALFPRLHWQIVSEEWPLVVHYHSAAMTIVIDIFLVMLSYGLLHGKRQSWRIVLVLLLASILLHILRRGITLSTFASMALVVLLLVFSSSFHVRSNPPSIRRGYLVTVIGLGLMALYAFGGFLSLAAHAHMPAGTQTLLFERVLPFLCLCTVLYGMGGILRPVASVLLPNKKQQQAVWKMVSGHGSNSISYFALSEDKSTFFSSSGRAIISYVLKGNVALVAGDPIGPEEELYAVTEQFMAFCRQQDWVPAFWQVRDEMAELYRSFGLRLLKIGEDAVIHTDGFTLKGKAMANVRSSARRAEKDGVRIVFYRGQIEHAEQLFQMQLISWAWMANKGGSEMGFSMGHFDMQENDEQVSALAVDGTNRVHAFVTFVPIYGRRGWGLDLMRRAEKAAPGCMELLLSCSIDYLKSTGAEMVSLGLAPMSNVNQEDQTGIDSIIDFLSQRYGYIKQSQSLFKFKQKFQPCWESRYLIYPHSPHLPKIGWALFAAHQQDTSWLAIMRRSLRDWQRKRRAAAQGRVGPTEPVTHPGTGQLAF